MEAYYYSKMNKLQKNVYHNIKIGLLALAPSFFVPKIDSRELQDIFFKVRLDAPEIFYAVSYTYRMYQDASNLEVIPEYLFEKKKIIEHQKAMKARIEKLIRPVKAMTEWEKERYIHDFICSSVYYDKLKKPYSHEIIGPLGQGVGVCEGIAKAVKILCDKLGIWCIIAISDSNPEKNIKYRHAWNIVQIEGVYYHIDVTFDNSLGRESIIRYDYFNLSDKQFFKDHEPVIYEVPKCTLSDRFYYREKKLSFTKLEDVGKRALQAMRKGNPLIFHWRGGYLTKEVLAELLAQLEQSAQKKEKHSQISLNWSQSILCVTFVQKMPEKEMVIEEANEGENL